MSIYIRPISPRAAYSSRILMMMNCRREQWPLTGAYACWQAALESTRTLARDHAALAELYGGPLAARLQRAADDALRLHRKCRDIGE